MRSMVGRMNETRNLCLQFRAAYDHGRCGGRVGGGVAFSLYGGTLRRCGFCPFLSCHRDLYRNTGADGRMDSGAVHTRGTLGAFERGGFPGGKALGIFLFIVVLFATGYYSNAVGWVAFHAFAQLINALGGSVDPSLILPPQAGFNLTSLFLQLLMTALVILTCGVVLSKGLRRGIEKTSKWIVPALFLILIVLIIRSVTLPGAAEGIRWYIGGFRFQALTPSVMAAALGMAFFSLSLGGTFMVIYGSYLESSTPIPKNAVFTGIRSIARRPAGRFRYFPGRICLWAGTGLRSRFDL